MAFFCFSNIFLLVLKISKNTLSSAVFAAPANSFWTLNNSDGVTAAPDLTFKVIFSYFGNIGRAQKLDYFLDLFMKVRNQKYEINIFGSGSEKTELMKKYKDHKIIYYVDSGYDYGLSILLIRQNIKYRRFKI